MYWFQNGSCAVPQHGSDQDVQRVVLLHVVAGHQQMPAEEIGQDESRGRDGDQDDVGPQRPRMCPESIHLGDETLNGAAYEAGRGPRHAATPWMWWRQGWLGLVLALRSRRAGA